MQIQKQNMNRNQQEAAQNEQRKVCFEQPRRSTRSTGPAPDIPNVLPAAIEYSNRTRREIQEIHEQHERRNEQ